MNRKQQTAKTIKRERRALLTKEITRREYKEILKGNLWISRGELMQQMEPGFAMEVRELETDFQRKKRLLDRDIDRLLGLRPENRYEDLTYTPLISLATP